MNGANLQPRVMVWFNGSGVATMSSKSSFRLNILNIYHTTGLIRKATPGYGGVPRARYQCAIGKGTYWLSLLLRILFFHLTTQTLLFFFQCTVSFFLWGYALIPALSACEIRTCYAPHLSFFASSKPEVYSATNKSENASGAAMRMNKM